MTDQKSILFICVANSARSQMAEGLARHYLPPSWSVVSAGSVPGQRVHPMAVEALREINIDISAHYPKSIESLGDQLSTFDFVANLCAEEQCPVLFTKARRLNWALEDPAGVPPEIQLQKFRQVREQIRSLLFSLLEKKESNYDL